MHSGWSRTVTPHAPAFSGQGLRRARRRGPVDPATRGRYAQPPSCRLGAQREHRPGDRARAGLARAIRPATRQHRRPRETPAHATVPALPRQFHADRRAPASGAAHARSTRSPRPPSRDAPRAAPSVRVRHPGRHPGPPSVTRICLSPQSVEQALQLMREFGHVCQPQCDAAEPWRSAPRGTSARCLRHRVPWCPGTAAASRSRSGARWPRRRRPPGADADQGSPDRAPWLSNGGHRSDTFGAGAFALIDGDGGVLGCCVDSDAIPVAVLRSTAG